MPDDAGPWGVVIGPTVEWITNYGSRVAAMIERDQFWGIVTDILQSFDGAYEELPWQYTEQGAQALIDN